MTQYQKPIRLNVPQVLEYTFLDQDGNVIDLTTNQTVILLVKTLGQEFLMVAPPSVSIVIPATGQVRCGYTFTVLGIWDAQFVVTTTLGARIYGDPVQFLVVPNVDDLAPTELPVY